MIQERELNPFKMIQTFQNDADALGGTPERIAAWKRILRFMNENTSATAQLNSFPDEMKGLSRDQYRQPKIDKLTMDDLCVIFSSLIASSNALHFVLQNEESRYFAIFNAKQARNIRGGEKVDLFAGETLKLVAKKK